MIFWGDADRRKLLLENLETPPNIVDRAQAEGVACGLVPSSAVSGNAVRGSGLQSFERPRARLREIPQRAINVGNSYQKVNIYEGGNVKHDEHSGAGSVSIAQIAKKLTEYVDSNGMLRPREPFLFKDAVDGSVWLKRQPPWNKSEVWQPKEVDEDDRLMAAEWIYYESREYWSVKPSSVGDAIRLVANRHTFDSLADWKKSLRWDGVERLSRLPTILGIVDSAHARGILTWFLQSIAARASGMEVSLDGILVVHGSTNAVKHEKVFQSLVPKANPIYVGFDSRLREDSNVFRTSALLSIHDASMFRGSSFLSLCFQAIKKGARATVVAFSPTVLEDRPDGYYLPLQADDEYLEPISKELAEQLIAEAGMGTPYLDSSWEKAALEESLSLDDGDPWIALIQKWYLENGIKETSIPCVMRDCLEIPKDRWRRGDQIRVGRLLLSLGFSNGPRRSMADGRRVRTYVHNASNVSNHVQSNLGGIGHE